MSSATLAYIQGQLSLHGNTVLMVIGNIGNAFIIIIFGQQRKTACSIYLTSSAVVNSLFLTINFCFTRFSFDYSVETLGAITYCKVSAYVLNILGQVAKTLLVFACIDRFLITCERASFREFSTIKRAKYVIFFAFIFWSLLTLHVPIMRSIVNGRCYASGIYSTIFALIFVGVFPLLTTAIFGYLAFRNMRKMKRRVQPTAQNKTNPNNTFQRRDRDLLVIVIGEVVSYVLATTLYPLILLETVISQSVLSQKSVQYSQVETFILSISYFLLFSNSAVPFYTYFISSKSFRRDVRKLITDGYHKITGLPPVENVSRTNQTNTQRETRV